MTAATELISKKKAFLARETAADKTTNPTGYTFNYRGKRVAFIAGWDAAMEYMSKQTSEGVEHLDGDECCHFQD